jgi:AcrR family transcriptional regulator
MGRREEGRRYRGKAARDRGVERRARFLEAGLQLFGTQGFAATTVKGLCVAAGLTERYFYQSFDDREQLFMEVAAGCVAGLMARLTAAHAPAGAPPPRAALDAFFAWFEEDPRRARIQLVEPLVMGPRFQALYRDVTAMFVDLVRSQALARFAPRLRAARVDPGALATALAGGAVELVKDWGATGFRRPRAELVRAMGLLLDGLTALDRRRPRGAK